MLKIPLPYICVPEALLIEAGARLKPLKKGDIVFLEGQVPRYYYQVAKGQVALHNFGEGGKEYTQGLFSSGQSFGEPPLFLKKPYPASAFAVVKSEVYQLPDTVFYQLLEDHHQLKSLFIEVLAGRVYAKVMNSRRLVNGKPEERVLSVLNDAKSMSGSKEKFLIPLTRQQIAYHTGLRVETVIRTVIKLRDAGVLEINKGKIYY